MAAQEGTVITCNTVEDFEANMARGKETGKLVIINFTASWVGGPSRSIASVFAEYAKEFPCVIFLKVDVDELKDLAERFGIRSMPTFIFIEDGEMIYEIKGANKSEINRKLVDFTRSTSA